MPVGLLEAAPVQPCAGSPVPTWRGEREHAVGRVPGGGVVGVQHRPRALQRVALGPKHSQLQPLEHVGIAAQLCKELGVVGQVDVVAGPHAARRHLELVGAGAEGVRVKVQEVLSRPDFDDLEAEVVDEARGHQMGAACGARGGRGVQTLHRRGGAVNGEGRDRRSG